MPSFESTTNESAVSAKNTNSGPALVGNAKAGVGVVGQSETNYAIAGESRTFPGVRGTSQDGRGIEGWSTNNDGLWGISQRASGVHGVSEHNGTGVVGESKIGRGVHGISETWQGVFGISRDNAGVVGESARFHAVYGESHDIHNAGVFGTNTSPGFGVSGICEQGTGIFGKGRLAGRFEGDVEVTGDIRLANADCAEDFEVAAPHLAEPGNVMVLGADGTLEPCNKPYDTRVVGVVSGAGAFRPAIVLDRSAKRPDRSPIALIGKVYCRADASFGAIAVGDLLTSSITPGHARRAGDLHKAVGAIIGKALQPLHVGRGLIPIVVMLR